ncbi:portal protein [Chelativorans xinjiangense]|uniref:portal protein n=1 Tax=Chelativorans xinjiangense TaxID=2681485 RepID=UPI00135B872C|nr:portal protein [Chelativorans xinjiangense]
MDSRARELTKIGDGLFKKKVQYDELCQEIAENFYPLRADFTESFTLGEDFATGIMDSFPVLARETLGNAPSAMLRQGEWFDVKTSEEYLNEDPSSARWMEHTTKHFRNLIYDRRANFVRATGEADHDWVAFGNPVLSVEESPDRSHFLFRSWHPKECAWMENGVGKIDHNQRNVMMTARGIMSRPMWAKNAHQSIKDAAQKEPTKEFKLRHIVLPLDEIYGDDKAKRRKFKDLSFVSLYIDCEHEIVLGEGGLPVFNYVIPRWKTISNYPQGFSPAAITALPDGRMLQSIARIVLEQGEKALDPPMYGRGEIFRDAINRYAGGMTYVDLEADENIRDAMMFEEPHQGFNAGLEMKADVRNLIAEAFLLNKLLLPAQREMTAFETQARLAEFRRAVLPFFGPVESEYHLPLLDVAFQMAVRNDQFNVREMPDALSEADVTFTFDSPLHTAEGRANVQAFQESVQILAGAAEFDQTVPTLMKFKDMTKDAVKGTGAPADWFNDEEVQQSEEEAAKAVEGLQAAAAALREGAGVASDVAGATTQLQQAGLA